MSGRFGVLALVAMSATGTWQGIATAQPGPPPAPDPPVAVVEPPSSRSLHVMYLQAAPPRGLRPLGPEAEELLAEARRLSPTVRRLLGELAASDVLVYLEIRPRPPWSWRPPWQPVSPAVLALLGDEGGVRYLKIEMYGPSSVKARIPWLGHELQHAVEIACAPEVTDEAGVRRLYERIGRLNYGGQDSFETTAAIRVGDRVLAELRSPPSTLAHARLPR